MYSIDSWLGRPRAFRGRSERGSASSARELLWLARLVAVVSALFTAAIVPATPLEAQGGGVTVSVTFAEGFIGGYPGTPNATAIRTLPSAGIVSLSFRQDDTNGKFFLQGNDIPGFVDILLNDGTTVVVPGAIVWRETSGARVRLPGFVPAPGVNTVINTIVGGNPVATAVRGDDPISTIGLKFDGAQGDGLVLTDGIDVNGNAANPTGTLNALNQYLGEPVPVAVTLAGPASVAAGSPSGPFTLTLVDGTGAPVVAGGAYTFSLSTADEAGTATFAPASVTIPAGSSTGTFTYTNTRVGDGIHSITATDASLSLAAVSRDIAVVPGAVSAANSSVVAAPLAVDADGVALSTVTVTLRDAHMNVIPGLLVTVAQNGAATVTPVSPTTNALGVATFTATNLTGQVVTFTASQGAVTITQTAQVTFLDVTPPTVTPKDPAAPALGGPVLDNGTPVLTREATVERLSPYVETFVANEPVTWTLESTLGVFGNLGPFTLDVNNGEATVTLPGTMAPGTYVVYLVATDGAGNRTVVRITVTVVDTTPPTVTPKDPAAPALGGPVLDNGTPVLTREATVERLSPYVETFVADEPVTWTLESTLGVFGNLGPFTLDVNNGEATVTLPGTMAPGTYVVYLVATDAAGNRTVVRITVVVEDTTPAVVTPKDPAAPALGGPVNDGGIPVRTRDATVERLTPYVETFVADEPVTWTLESTLGVFGNLGPFTLAVNNGEATVTLPGTMPAGTYVVYLVATDASGNRTVVRITVVVEDTTPAVVTPKDPGAPALGGPVNDGGTPVRTRDATVERLTPYVETFVADEPVTWTLESTLGVFGNLGPFTLSVNNGEATVTLPGTMPAGTYVVYLVATDASGNRSVVRITVVVQDTTPPAVTSNDGGPLGAAVDNGTPVLTRDALIEEGERYVETFVADEPVTWTLESTLGVFGNLGPFTLSVSGTGVATVTLPETMPAGTYVVYLVATDASGNRTVVRITVVVDAAIPQVIDLTGVAGDSKVDLQWTRPTVVRVNPIIGYDIEYRTYDRDWTPAGTFATESAEIPGLRNGVVHEFRVTARTANRTGPVSAPPLPLTPLAPARDALRALPVPDPGVAQEVFGGQVRPLEYQVIDNDTRVRLSNGDFSITLGALSPNGSPAPIFGAQRRVIAEAGGSLAYGGIGFQSGTVSALWLYGPGSGLVLLGTVVVGADGTFSGTAPMPENLEPGVYTVQVTGVDRSGTPRSAALTIIVGPDNGLSIRVRIVQQNPMVGDEIDILVTVMNESVRAAPDVIVTDAIPTNRLTILGWTEERGTFQATSGTWTIGRMEAGERVVLSIRARVIQPSAPQGD